VRPLKMEAVVNCLNDAGATPDDPTDLLDLER
jgi:hypothetical protein